MNGKNLFYFLGGLVAGAIAITLLAPESGEALRKRVAKILEDKGISRDRLDEIIQKIKDQWAKAKSTSLEDIINQVIKNETIDIKAEEQPGQDPATDQQV
ncbi:MAG: YtxH domain-containing protein [Paludibacteraceae bacterium]|nr:YtxH domain-containing protein [Paludibacteraceae bacterium]